MAIDDNTIYGLYGSQIKDLPEKIKAVEGKARALTTDDYNWNRITGTGTDPNCVAAWRLNAGIYTGIDVNVVFYPWAGTASRRPSLVIVGEANPTYGTMILYKESDGRWTVGSAKDTAGNYNTILMDSDVTDNLTSTYTTLPLSANQGKVLKDFIGDLTNLTTTDKTNLVAAINEAAAGGGGGGGITELTSADYDYPTNNPNRVLLSNLPSGVYYRPSSVSAGDASNLLGTNQNFFVVMQPSSGTNTYVNILGASGSAVNGVYTELQVWRINKSTGNRVAVEGALTTENLSQTTGTSTTNVMSQNATTSMVFADPSTTQKVQIGNGSTAVGDYAVAIGRSAQVNNANGSVALGFNANVGSAHYWSVALGANSSTTSNGEVSFGGPGVSGLGYNNSNYRLLTNVYDPQSAHDAATKGYVDTAVGAKQDVLTAGDNITIAEESGALVISSTGGGADAFTTNEWNALWA